MATRHALPLLLFLMNSGETISSLGQGQSQPVFVFSPHANQYLDSRYPKITVNKWIDNGIVNLLQIPSQKHIP